MFPVSILLPNHLNLETSSTTARIGDPMHFLKVIDQRLVAVGLLLLLVCGCASNRGGAGVERVSREPLNHPNISVAQSHQPSSHASAPGNRDQYRYHYYPASEVYYSTWRHLYFYTEGDVWVSDALLPYRLRKSLGKYVSVAIYADTPYEYHEYLYKKGYKFPAEQEQGKKNNGWVKY